MTTATTARRRPFRFPPEKRDAITPYDVVTIYGPEPYGPGSYETSYLKRFEAPSCFRKKDCRRAHSLCWVCGEKRHGVKGDVRYDEDPTCFLCEKGLIAPREFGPWHPRYNDLYGDGY